MLYGWLFRIANDAAKAEQQRGDRIMKEIETLEKRKTELNDELALTRESVSRFDQFEPTIGHDFQCALCWIRRGVRSAIKQIPSVNGTDMFRCETCHSEFSKG